jgi:hypothetical protein
MAFILCFAASISFGAVEICKYYDDSDVVVMLNSDDMFADVTNNDVRWTNFLEYVEFMATSNMVADCAVIAGNMTDPNAWTMLQTAINSYNNLGFFGNHSYNHPSDMPTVDWQLQLGTSKAMLETNVTHRWQYTYKDEAYLPLFYGFGGLKTNATDYLLYTDTNQYYNVIAPHLWTNNYLAVRHPSTMYIGVDPFDRDGWPEWNGYYGIYDAWHMSSSEADIYDGDYSNHFNVALASNQFYMAYTHSWTTNGDIYGVNSNKWVAYREFLSGRTNVWYASSVAAIVYRYMYDKAPPTISGISSNDTQVTFTVTGNSSERDKYGLSYPLTYKVDKPTTWSSGTQYTVEYKDTGGWSALTEKQASDIFTDINCYRDDTSVVYVSQGLPQQSDSFQIRIRRSRSIPKFFVGGG